MSTLDATTAEFLRLLYPLGVTPAQFPSMLSRVKDFDRWRSESARATATSAANAEAGKPVASGRMCAVEGCPKSLRSDNKSGLCNGHNKNAQVYHALLAQKKQAEVHGGPLPAKVADPADASSAKPVKPLRVMKGPNGSHRLAETQNPWLDDKYRPGVQGAEREKNRARIASLIAADAKNGGGE